MTARADVPPTSGPSGGDIAARKAAWRVRIRAARRALAPQVRAERAGALTVAVLDLAAATGGPVCAFVPVGSEPWSADGLDALRAAGHDVLLPVVPGAPGPLDWGRYDGRLAAGPHRLREPAGPRLGPAAVADARLVLLPALAVDRRGVRLGQGGGHYDRTLPQVAPGVPLVAVVDDGELVDELPAEPHDVRVTAAVLPTSGVTMLGATR